jgi:RimJ/RimL family protein N-acetyltransferase
VTTRSPRPEPLLRLEPLAEQHLAGMEALIADLEVLRFTRVPEPPPDGFARGWLDRYRRGRAEGTRFGFAALDADGRFAGLALAPHVDAEAREVELGYIVAPAARGRGVATEIVRRLTRWAFDELGMLRAYLLIDTDNAASERVAERAGYVREGVMRSVHLKLGRRIDQAVWSRLPSDE